VRRERFERKKEQGAKLLKKVSESGLTSTIRGEQIPPSLAEAKFKARAVEKGWRPHRPSWPDFLVETENGVIAVEVKSRTDTISKTQRLTFSLLEASGVPVYIWRDSKDSRATLVKWDGGQGLIKIGLA